MWRILAGPVALGLAFAGAAFAGAQGYRLEAARPEAIAAAEVGAIVPDPAVAPPAQPAGSQASLPPAAPPASADPAPPEQPEGVAADVLRKAVEGGVPALTALSTKHPQDPAVLDALARALGKEPEKSSELLRVLDALFTVAPDKATDEELAKLVMAAAVAPSTSARAIELMRARMGLSGAEMLFDLMIARPEIRPRARAALESSEVQRALSPALKIAYDLYAAPSCDARLELLDEAVRDGDERAVHALAMQTAKTLKGCGPRRNKPCPAPCGQHTAAFDAAAQKIKTRIETEAGG